jgi:hypothetical protein
MGKIVDSCAFIYYIIIIYQYCALLPGRSALMAQLPLDNNVKKSIVEFNKLLELLRREVDYAEQHRDRPLQYSGLWKLLHDHIRPHLTKKQTVRCYFV